MKNLARVALLSAGVLAGCNLTYDREGLEFGASATLESCTAQSLDFCQTGARAVCTDLATDAQNCGWCGNSCGTQPCQAGTCNGAILTETEPNGSMTTANPVSLGRSVSGAIDPTGDVDDFTFVVPDPGLDVHLQTFDSSGATCVAVDPSITLFDASGRTVGGQDNLSPVSCEDLTITLPAGAYTVSVSTAQTAPFGYVLKLGGAPMSPSTYRVVSCSYSTGGSCTQFSGPLSSIDLQELPASCAPGGGVFSPSGCPLPGALAGSCAMPMFSYGADTSTSLIFYSPMFDPVTAPSACANAGGVWQP